MRPVVALLRAVNVGGTGKLPMADLRAMCEEIGFHNVRTYIASGNVVFQTDMSSADAKAALEHRLAVYAGKPVAVMVRGAEEMAAILDANPFPDVAGNKAVVVFLDASPPADAVARVTHQNGEEIKRGHREIYVHYVNGQGASKLRMLAAETGTARNMNTVRKLVQIEKG